jgi:hypothetical protein
LPRETADFLHASTGSATLENTMVLLGIDIEGFVVSRFGLVLDLRPLGVDRALDAYKMVGVVEGGIGVVEGVVGGVGWPRVVVMRQIVVGGGGRR